MSKGIFSQLGRVSRPLNKHRTKFHMDIFLNANPKILIYPLSFKRASVIEIFYGG